MIADQFTWFDAQLAKANSAGKKVWLLMHAPPGAEEGTTAAASNDVNGKITAATMMWVDTNQEKFMGIIEKYPGVIAMSLAGHTHMDEFRLMSPGNALKITAGISAFFGNNPAYKIFTFDSLSLAPFDYSAVNCNLWQPPPRSTAITRSRKPISSMALSPLRCRNCFPPCLHRTRPRCNTRAHSIPGTTQ